MKTQSLLKRLDEIGQSLERSHAPRADRYRHEGVKSLYGLCDARLYRIGQAPNTRGHQHPTCQPGRTEYIIELADTVGLSSCHGLFLVLIEMDTETDTVLFPGAA